MEFKIKVIYRTLENSKKPSFWPEFGPFDLNIDSQYFFVGFTTTSK